MRNHRWSFWWEGAAYRVYELTNHRVFRYRVYWYLRQSVMFTRVQNTSRANAFPSRRTTIDVLSNLIIFRFNIRYHFRCDSFT